MESINETKLREDLAFNQITRERPTNSYTLTLMQPESQAETLMGRLEEAQFARKLHGEGVWFVRTSLRRSSLQAALHPVTGTDIMVESSGIPVEEVFPTQQNSPSE